MGVIKSLLLQVSNCNGEKSLQTRDPSRLASIACYIYVGQLLHCIAIPIFPSSIEEVQVNFINGDLISGLHLIHKGSLNV